MTVEMLVLEDWGPFKKGQVVRLNWHDALHGAIQGWCRQVPGRETAVNVARETR